MREGVACRKRYAWRMLGLATSLPSVPPALASTVRRSAILVTLTALLVVALVLGVACGSESGGASNASLYDSGTSSGSSGGSSGGGDASFFGDGAVDGGAEASVPPAHALFVLGSPSLPDARLCWSVNGVVPQVVPFPGAGAMPGSNYPGIPLGGAASLDGDASLPVGTQLTLYAIDAENLARLEQGQATQDTCDKLICGQGVNLMPPCLRYGLDYWPVAPTSAVVPGSNVVAIVGCLASGLDPTATTARCGVDWAADAGNLRVDVSSLGLASGPGDAGDASDSGSPGSLTVQVALLSPALTALMLAPDAGSHLLNVSFGSEDGGTVVAAVAQEGPVGTPSTVTLGSGLAAYGQLGFSVDLPGVPAAHEWMSLAQAQQLVDPTEDPAVYFGQPRTYLVAILGDPNATHAFATGDAGYDGTGLHLLVVAAP